VKEASLNEPPFASAGAELRFLQPNFNPIEMAFAKLTGLAQEASTQNVDDL